MTRSRPIQTRRRHAARAALAGLVLVLLAGGAVVATADPTGPALSEPVTVLGDTPATPPATPVTQRQLPPTATVTLVTGDRVRLTSSADGLDVESVSTGAEDAGTPLVQFGWAGDRYAVPAEAVPYLGSTLDPQLFNVTYLVRAGLDDAHSSTVPVTIRENGGKAAGLPSVSVARTADNTATGTVTKKGATALGALLADHWAASRSGRPSTATGKLPGIDTIRLAAPKGAPAAPASPLQADAQPKAAVAKYHTITLDPIDRAGRPGVAVGFLHNLDDPARYASFVIAAGAGPQSFSVPEGIYSIEYSVLSGDPADESTTAALVLEPELTVRSDRTVTLDARKAVPYEVSLDSPIEPKPGWRTDKLTFARLNDDRHGLVSAPWLEVDGVMELSSSPRTGAQTLYATPTSPVTTGYLGLSGFTALSDSISTSANPRYLMAFTWDQAVPDSLTSVVPKADLTSVRTEAYGTPSGGNPTAGASINPSAFTPWGYRYFGHGGRGPHGERLDYWYSNEPDLVAWRTLVRTDESTDLYSAPRRIKPGEQIREEWNKGPLVPSAGARHYEADAITRSRYFGTNGPDGTDMLKTVCAACRQDDNGIFVVNPLGDSGGHYSHAAVATNDRLPFIVDFYRDGVLAITSRSQSTAVDVSRLRLPMLPHPADYRLEMTNSRQGDPAATQRTVWAFRSGRDDKIASLPDLSRCQPDPSRECSFLPLLFPTYDLPLDLTSRAPAGTSFELPFSVGYQQYQGTPAGLAATVSVSFDGGATWTDPATATDRGDGRFTTTVTHPPLDQTDGFVAIRVQARDAAGNTVDQTITRAYGLSQI